MDTQQRYAVGYIRVSSARQADEGVSLDVQRKKIESYCELHQLQLIGIHADEGISGRKMSKRPGVQAAVDQACEMGAVLVVYKLDRLARSAGDAEHICERMAESGADIACVNDPIDTTTPIGRAFFSIITVIARLESDITAERIKDAIRSRTEELGFNPTGAKEFGYTLSEDKTQKIRNPAEMAIVAEILMLRKRGDMCVEIAKHLNATETPTYRQIRGYKKAPARWTAGMVWHLIRRHAPELSNITREGEVFQWDDQARKLLGTMTDKSLAQKLGCSRGSVTRERIRCNIPPYQKSKSPDGGKRWGSKNSEKSTEPTPKDESPSTGQ